MHEAVAKQRKQVSFGELLKDGVIFRSIEVEG